MRLLRLFGYATDEERRRREELQAAWRQYEEVHLPPDWWAMNEVDLSPSGDLENLPWHDLPARPTGPLPRLEASEAVALIRRSRWRGIMPPTPVAPDARFSRRGEAVPRPIGEEFLPFRSEYLRVRGWDFTEEERSQASSRHEEKLAWLETEVFRIGPYDPGVAAATLEAAGYWDSRIISDYWLLAGDVNAAAEALDAEHLARRLNLRRFASTEVTADEVGMVAWWGAGSLTPFAHGRRDEFIDHVVRNADQLLANAPGGQLLEALFAVESLAWTGWRLHFPGHTSLEVDKLLIANLSGNREVRRIVEDFARAAENHFRVHLGIPRVGEGWVSETELFRAVEAALAGETPVIHHGRPDGFGQQHLDVWIPEWRIGLEFQGLQHDQPVEFFGGQEAFEATKRRDAEKRSKAKRLGIHLIEVRPGFDFEDVLRAIEAARRSGLETRT